MIRFFERRMARRYWHRTHPYRRCKVGLCLGCWWRSLTGRHRRNRRAASAWVNETKHTWPVIRIGKKDEGEGGHG